MTHTPSGLPNDQAPPDLLEALRGLIVQARQQVLRQVDVVQVQTCWHIGRYIVEFEQGGQARAAYGKRLLPQLGQALTREFGKGFAFVARQQVHAWCCPARTNCAASLNETVRR